jgi:acyl-CoA reductase-like NAD-dependent aldehyde dehydrogenase
MKTVTRERVAAAVDRARKRVSKMSRAERDELMKEAKKLIDAGRPVCKIHPAYEGKLPPRSQHPSCTCKKVYAFFHTRGRMAKDLERIKNKPRVQTTLDGAPFHSRHNSKTHEKT